jgi:hypothetical protein
VLGGKTDRKREAEQWLKNNPEFSEDVDAQMTEGMQKILEA